MTASGRHPRRRARLPQRAADLRRTVLRRFVPLCWLRFIRVLLAAGFLLPCAGCFTYRLLEGAPQPTDLLSVVPGARQQDVEVVLGQPVDRSHIVSTYEYDTGMAGPSSPARYALLPVAVLLDAITTVFLAQPFIIAQDRRNYEKQRTRLRIVYAPDGTVAATSYEEAETSYRLWFTDAQPEKRLNLLCRAANGGHAVAQFAQANRYQYGLWGTSPDPVQAQMWARLAGNSAATTARQAWAADMSSEDLNKSAQLYETWHPGDCHDEADL